jgi:hypothetical protein
MSVSLLAHAALGRELVQSTLSLTFVIRAMIG